MAKRTGKLPHDKAVLACALLSGLPAVALALGLLWWRTHDSALQWSLSVLIIACWVGFAAAARNHVVRPLQTMANLLLALREGDYSFRAHGARFGDSLGDALAEINELGSVLQTQRRSAVEATALLRTVMEEIDVAVFAFDHEQILRLVNRAGEKLLGQPADRLLGRSAEAIGLAECLEGEATRMLAPTTFPGTHGRWGLRRTLFREGGRPHQLVVTADLSQPLREEELKAWQRLVRVLGHELNNSLAPIKSIAGSLGAALKRAPRPPDWEADLSQGLGIIAARAEGLARFLQAYSRLARLPPPVPTPCQLADLVQHAVALETRLPIVLRGGPALELRCDSAQIEQALINLVQNAVDAALEQRSAAGGTAGVRLGWRRAGAAAEVRIEDDGPGIAQTANLFVPFFTTKPEGSGIGLVLCRQIAENHGGALTLANRTGATGCVALLRLPLPTRQS
jgi:two-component system, NtrC family, nitrogen regulation sensor histidine kinase NtrY